MPQDNSSGGGGSSSSSGSSSCYGADSSSSIVPAGRAGAQLLKASSSSSPSNLSIQCRVVQNFGPNGTWLAYFDAEDNVIRVNHWRWDKPISSNCPINCEGVVCTNRLQMLLHTLAHELVHAVVYHLFPELDASSVAYLADDRHGPIFQLLNKQLFGHSSNALEMALATVVT
jgi:hypothetical protein